MTQGDEGYHLAHSAETVSQLKKLLDCHSEPKAKNLLFDAVAKQQILRLRLRMTFDTLRSVERGGEARAADGI